MRRLILLMAAMGATVLVVSGVAYALSVQCDGTGDQDPDPGECQGTEQNDRITGSQERDEILAQGGRDLVSARGGTILSTAAGAPTTSTVALVRPTMLAIHSPLSSAK